MWLFCMALADSVPEIVGDDPLDASQGATLVEWAPEPGSGWTSPAVDIENSHAVTDIGVEPGVAFWTDMGTTDATDGESWIEIEVPAGTCLEAVRVFARHDTQIEFYNRSMSRFRVVADGAEIANEPIEVPYQDQPDNQSNDAGQLDLTIPFGTDSTATTYRFLARQNVEALSPYNGVRIQEIDGIPCEVDADGDGVWSSTDCDDADPAVGGPTIWYQDQDDDLYGTLASTTLACTAPSSYVGVAGDCDDNDAHAYPGAPELCNERDDDCDTVVDNDTTDIQWYLDDDGDGYGDAPGALQCGQPSGQVALPGDCDDADEDVSPAAQEVCDAIDNDCDGSIDTGAADALAWFDDGDGDGYGHASTMTLACTMPPGTVALAGDCDDSDATVGPDALEICDGIDNNCDGQVDLDAPHPTQWYPDSDGDLYGDEAAAPLSQCSQPVGYVQDATDCDDAAVEVNPGEPEQCDLIDHDCDGVLDNDTMDRQFYLDADGDGYGSTVPGAFDCQAPPGQVANTADCDDTNPSVSPAGTEVCNGIDDDCDGAVDTDAVVGADTYFGDVDGDGFGDPHAPVLACSQPTGAASEGTDCDDDDALTFPGAAEICDQADNDCNGSVDEGLPVLDWYLDEDGDGFGDGGAPSEQACGPSGSRVADHTDCDDTDATRNPASVETCDGQDDDCDQQVDEGLDESWYPDLDGDGFGDTEATPLETCDAGDGYVLDHTDCDDSDASIHPQSTEIPDNSVDEDCDGTYASSLPPTQLDTGDTSEPATDDGSLGLTCSHAAHGGGPWWAGWLRQ